MTALPFIQSAFRRNNGDQVEARLVNVFLEASATDEDGVVMLSRAGLITHSSPGTAGPVRGMFSNADLFGGDLISVVNGDIYRNTTLVGALAGTGPVSFATDGIDELLITAGTTMRRYDGTTLSNVAFPDSANVLAVDFLSGLFVSVRGGSGRFYWSAVNNGNSWNALDYATAESAADYLLDLKVIGDTVWLLGRETVEPWSITGSSLFPFRRIQQRLYKRGVIGTGCCTEVDGVLYWIGNDARVYSDDLSVISDEGIAERIKESTTWAMFSFTYEGHPFICVRLDTGTWVYSPPSQNWVEFKSYNRANWRVRTAMSKDTRVFLGDDELNRIWEFGGNDDNGSVIECIWSSYLPIPDGAVLADNILVTANSGRTTKFSGVAGGDPVLEMRASRDEGKTWTDWRSQSMGLMGQYRNRIKFRRCGMLDSPGALFEFRHTDKTSLRVSGMYINEPGGGRGR